MKQPFTLFILSTLLSISINTFGQTINYSFYADELKAQGFKLDDKLAPFYHGVASGDPLSDRVIIWTRVTPPKKQASHTDWKLAFTVSWKVATDTAFTDIVRNGDIATDETKDFTVKIDVTGLKPNTTYYYQFEAFDKKSIIGTTKTACGLTDETPVKLAFTDGNNYTDGFFNVYGRLSEMKDLNAVVVLSDYISKNSSSNGVRGHIPANKPETLQDFRNRYAQYHTDKELMKAHSLFPFIVIWENQQVKPVSEKWDDQQKAAEQAFIEWLPVRVTKGEFQRKLIFGKMLELYMVETTPLEPTSLTASTSGGGLEEEMPFMEQSQRESLTKQLNYSTATWKVLATRNLMSSINSALIEPVESKSYDVWDNHPKDKESLLGFTRSFSLKNIIVASGGFHNSLGAEVSDSFSGYDPAKGKFAAMVEIAVPSTTALSLTETDSGRGSAAEAKSLNKIDNPHIKMANFLDHGFVLMNFTKKETKVNWYFMKETKINDQIKIKLQTEMTVRNGESILEK